MKKNIRKMYTYVAKKSSCKCLGVTIDSNLSWQEHTKSLLKSFNKKIAVLKKN